MDKQNRMFALILLIAVIIATIVIIRYIKANGQIDEETMKCIAERAKMIVSKTCHVCAAQEELLGEYLGLFEMIDVEEHPEVFEQYNITGVPTWIIEEKGYPGYQTIENLKELTGC